MFSHTWKTGMSRAETRLGTAFFLLYLFALPHLNAWTQQRFAGEGEALAAEANVLYYLILFVVAIILFRQFLKRDFLDLLDALPENLAGVGAGLLLAGGLWALLSHLPLPLPDPILEQYVEEFWAAPLPTMVLLLILIPLVEEVFYRGLLYGHLRNVSTPLALTLCVPFYAFACVWRYALETADPRYLLLGVLYLPLSAAATLCYENGGSIWGTAVLHGGVNALTLMLAVH